MREEVMDDKYAWNNLALISAEAIAPHLPQGWDIVPGTFRNTYRFAGVDVVTVNVSGRLEGPQWYRALPGQAVKMLEKQLLDAHERYQESLNQERHDKLSTVMQALGLTDADALHDPRG